MVLPGKAHIAAGCLCEDVVTMRESADFYFYGLADGQSRKKHCRKGAEISLSTAEEYISASGIDIWHREPYPHSLQHGLEKSIQTALKREAAARSCDLLEFGSTLAALAVEPCSGRYVLVHIGDGGSWNTRHRRGKGSQPAGERTVLKSGMADNVAGCGKASARICGQHSKLSQDHCYERRCRPHAPQ